MRDQACVEDIDFYTPRGLSRTLILELAEARWVESHQNVLVIGATGLGKTYVACALAEAAIRKGHSALYMRFPRMVDELAVARVDGRLPRLLAAWARVEVLLLDDFAMQPLSSQQSADLLEVIEDRSQRRSTILTSQMPVKQWHEALGDATIAVHNAHRIELRGTVSLRGPRPPATSGPDAAAETPQPPAPAPAPAGSRQRGDRAPAAAR